MRHLVSAWQIASPIMVLKPLSQDPMKTRDTMYCVHEVVMPAESCRVSVMIPHYAVLFGASQAGADGFEKDRIFLVPEKTRVGMAIATSPCFTRWTTSASRRGCAKRRLRRSR